MHRLFDEFRKRLENEDKEGCVEFVLGKLSNGELDILTLYSEILTPSQNERECKQEQTFCIWKEHVETSIIRTIIECCYPIVVKERERYSKPNGKHVLIGCPSEEYHEIGARMVSDYFTLLGYNVVFVGANTPQKEIMDAIQHVRPEYIGISVTNFYNLVAARKLIEQLVTLRKIQSLDFKIIVGGNAFKMNPGTEKEMGADALLQDFHEIKRYCQGGE